MTRQYKSSTLMAHGLETALKQERKKYGSHPVLRDLMPDHMNAQGWCYVVAGYFLLEMSFKAILQARGGTPPSTHSLSTLFRRLVDHDQDVLREYYHDYQATIGGRVGDFPIRNLDDFLVNLDGSHNEREGHVGSFEWRYCLIETSSRKKMPYVCVDYLHELVYGCVRIIVYTENGRFPPKLHAHSFRLRSDRQRAYDHWLETQMLSEEWQVADERWIVLWGPDYRGRFDLLHHVQNGYSGLFDEWPTGSEIPVYDVRPQVKRVLASHSRAEAA